MEMRCKSRPKFQIQKRAYVLSDLEKVVGIILLNLHKRIFHFLAHETIRLEILHQSPLQFYISSITTMKDEVFLLGKRGRHCHTMTVYDRNNMPEVKEVVSLARLHPKSIVACSVSNCVYVLSIKRRYRCSIVRIASDGEHWSTKTPLISYLSLREPTLCVTANGCLIISGQQTEELAPISVWDANGSLQREIRLSDDILNVVSYFWHVIPKSNGNLVLAVAGAPNILMEIDLDGIIILQHDFLLSCDYKCATSHGDSYGRVLNIDFYQNMKLFDAEFNLVEFTGPQLGGGFYFTPHDLGYNSERNELVTIVSLQGYQNGCLVIFHFTEM